MKRNEALDYVTAEFKSRGIRFETETTGSNHIEIRWQVSKEKEVRSYFVPNSPSDVRGRLNARAQVRRLLRQDGVKLEQEPAPRSPATLLARALDMPKPELPIPELIKALRAEVADLTELVLEMGVSVSVVRDHLLKPQMQPERKPSVRSKKLLDFVAPNWNSLDAIARDMALPVEKVKHKCYYLKDKVELSGGRVRLRPAKPHVVQR
jgi:hypothetical protein